MVTGVPGTRPEFYNKITENYFSESTLRSLAGNAMPVYMIGAALLMVLGVTETVAEDTELA